MDNKGTVSHVCGVLTHEDAKGFWFSIPGKDKDAYGRDWDKTGRLDTRNRALRAGKSYLICVAA